MTEESQSRAGVEVEDVAIGTLVYIVGLIFFGFISFAAVIVWSLIGLFVALGIARFAAHMRATREISDENARWIAQHRDAIEEFHRQSPGDNGTV
jgi:Zn-dependent membrane protease YugP